MEMLPEAVRATDEPLADLTIVPLLAVSRLACEHVKVVLSGEGADEILAGYNLDKVRQHFETIKRLQTLPAGLLKPLSHGMGLLSNKYGDALARAASVPLSRWNLELKNHMTWTWNESEKGALWPSFKGRDSDFLLEGMYGAASSPDPFDQLLSVYQQSWLVEDLLMKADKITMAASLELRVPFLDYRLVEWANRQPADVKVGRVGRQYVTKHVLRRFAQKRLPAEILERPKQGFPVPVNRWLTDERFSKSVAAQLTGEGAKVATIFPPVEIERQLGQASTGDLKAADRVWLLVILETWLRQYGVELEPDAPSEAEVATSGVNRLR
jgi:asparagine synthase (glutamine-hydrolysing)